MSGFHRISKIAADAFRRQNRAVSGVATVANKSQDSSQHVLIADTPPSDPIVHIQAPYKPQKKTRTAYYARVSSLLESQQQSIESQQVHFENYIRSRPDLEFAGAYVDEGLSGTKVEIRTEFQRLIQDCEDHKIDLICTKSISRFARNTTELLETVRKLTSLGVTIWFEEQNIRTDIMTSELMLTLYATIAESESHSISGNVKWGIRKRFLDSSYLQTIIPYGYMRENGHLEINPSQAEVIRRIFSMVLSGYGMNTIVKELNEEKIPSPAGKHWTEGPLKNIVTNPVYRGDMLYQKTFRDEHFIQRMNNGELDQYYDEGHHKAIITPESFDNAQIALAQRARETERKETKTYCFTGILRCKVCGSVLHRQTWNGERPCWICQNHKAHPDLCSMKPQSEADLKRAFVNCLNKLSWCQKQRESENRLLDVYETMLGKTEAEKNAERLAQIEKELSQNKKEARILNASIMRERFLPKHRDKKAFLAKQERELMEEKNSILLAGVPKGTLQGLKSLVKLWKITDVESTFPEDVFTEYVTGCVVDSGKIVEFQFKCGLKLTESLCRKEL